MIDPPTRRRRPPTSSSSSTGSRSSRRARRRGEPPPRQRESMKTSAAFLLTLMVAGITAPGGEAQTRSLPTFEVDRGWPKVPPQWKAGDASSFAIDAQDNVWLLSRPRTLKPEDAGKAAPPVMMFDTAGTFIKAWGGSGSGFEWPEREHGIHVDDKGFVWITGNNCPTNGLPRLKPVADDQILKFTNDGKF